MKRLAVVLLAPAIPTDYFEPGGRLEASITVSDKVLVLHSDSDRVLSSVFGLGQTLGRECWFPEAVGYLTRPYTASFKRRKMHSFGHGSYFSEDVTAQLVCGLLGTDGARSGSTSALVQSALLRTRMTSLMPPLPDVLK